MPPDPIGAFQVQIKAFAFASKFVRRIGSCAKCMRESFLVAVGVLLVTIPIATIGVVLDTDWLAASALIAVFAASALWLIHLVVFSFRAVTFVEAKQIDDEGVHFDRRRAVSIFASAFLFGIGLTARASAQTCPPNWRCEDFYCSDRNSPQLLCNYLRCETMCIPARANGCMSEYETWYCPEGSNCLGDGSSQRPAGCS